MVPSASGEGQSPSAVVPTPGVQFPVVQFPVVQFLSPEWVEAFDQAASSCAGLGEAFGGVDVSVEHLVRGAPDGEVRFHVAVTGGAARVRSGRASGPAVTAVSDYRVALAIHRGETSAEQALAQGDLKLAGSLDLLLLASRGLARLGDAFVELRARTSYGDAQCDPQ